MHRRYSPRPRPRLLLPLVDDEGILVKQLVPGQGDHKRAFTGPWNATRIRGEGDLPTTIVRHGHLLPA